MGRRQPQKPASAAAPESSLVELRRALSQRKKADLVTALVELAQADPRLLRRLTVRFDVAATPDELVRTTRQAMAEATAFDPRDINQNFAYNVEAYAEVKRDLGRLVQEGQLRPALQLALELMQQGSHPVEMSDEGLMTQDIEDCLSVVLQALPKSAVPAAEGAAWCMAMLNSDRLGFIARQALQSLQSHFATATRQ